MHYQPNAPGDWGSMQERKTYPGYAHDSEFENDRSQMDDDVVTWIREHAATASSVSLSQLT